MRRVALQGSPSLAEVDPRQARGLCSAMLGHEELTCSQEKMDTHSQTGPPWLPGEGASPTPVITTLLAAFSSEGGQTEDASTAGPGAAPAGPGAPERTHN